MRYWYLDIEITCGEYEFHSKSLHKTSGKEMFDAEDYVADFYDGACDDNPQDETYYFNGGEIACQVYDIKEITQKEYNLLRSFI